MLKQLRQEETNIELNKLKTEFNNFKINTQNEIKEIKELKTHKPNSPKKKNTPKKAVMRFDDVPERHV